MPSGRRMSTCSWAGSATEASAPVLSTGDSARSRPSSHGAVGEAGICVDKGGFDLVSDFWGFNFVSMYDVNRG